MLPIVTLVLFLVILISAAPKQRNFSWGSDIVRGLNIGGWLVLEPWITPSIFDNLDQSLGIKDEFTLGQKLKSSTAHEILKRHWDSWVTFQDFQRISDVGFNTVRIPIGYWAYTKLEEEPYIQGAAPYLDSAINWARLTGLKVWIDLHGAPGSQNGFDNSGHFLSKPLWQSSDKVNVTLTVLHDITVKYTQPEYQDVVVGIELLNEPLGPELSLDSLKKFYRDAFNDIRAISQTTVILHDSFMQPKFWNGFLSVSDNNSHGVVIDHHEYQVFTNELVALQPHQHQELACNNAVSYSEGSDKWIVVGEWTAAMTDCAVWLNGYHVGSRYDGSYPGSSYIGSCEDKKEIKNWNETYRRHMRSYIEAQIFAFETYTQGWIFWNFKTQGAHEWDAFALLDAGIFPQPLEGAKYSTVCPK
ncbi:exo-1,3-beta-glucanase [Blumeria hordei DH14]|uniref:glucan 1,3-beta-glucosidase n=1 Tax=Blumeria graminis f. sp. hordei (strain DH14) TaxID=546991 RepID=N1JLP4_BLUG1|nr:exo-1,3-beta-glucanase [Blumeria hordei DH14]